MSGEKAMGLDSVELVLEVENAFGFSIPDEDAAGLTTVGKLYDYVLAHRFRGKQDVCLSSMTFYKLRRGLMLVLQVPRNSVRVSTEVSAIIPKHRRRSWRALEKATGFRLPFLRRPGWVVTLAHSDGYWARRRNAGIVGTQAIWRRRYRGDPFNWSAGVCPLLADRDSRVRVSSGCCNSGPTGEGDAGPQLPADRRGIEEIGDRRGSLGDSATYNCESSWGFGSTNSRKKRTLSKISTSIDAGR